MTEKTQGDRIYRDRVLKCLTEKPGMVVYRDDIVHETSLTDEQVMGCLSQLKRDEDNPLSSDIEIVVPGRAWRYVPHQRVQRAVRTLTGGKNKVDPRIAKAIAEGRPLPLTHRIREYFANNARRVVYMDELHSAMNTSESPATEEQVRVGIANARINNTAFRQSLTIVTPGKAWMFTPSDESQSDARDAASELPSSTTTAPVRSSSSSPSSPSPSPSPSSPVPVAATSNGSGSADEQMLLLEYLGNTNDGGALYRDEDKNLYRVERL